MVNPYESPAELVAGDLAKPYSERISKLARWSWKLPLIGIAALFSANILGLLSQSVDSTAYSIAVIFGISCIGCIVVGLLLSIFGIVCSFTYSDVAISAVFGFVVNSLLATFFFVVFYAFHTDRDAVFQARQREMMKQRTQESSSSTPGDQEP
jgi:uncharacterized protein YacL